MRWFTTLMVWAIPTVVLAEPPATIVITGVTVIDGTGAAPQPQSTIIITGDRITQIGKTGEVKIPDGARVIAAEGKYIIPGLCDMHTHVEAEALLPMYVGNGVTGVRHMFTGSPLFPPIKRWQKEVEEGTRIGPRIVACLKPIDGLIGEKPAASGRPIIVTNEKEAREAVRQLREESNDFVKVYSSLKPEAFFAILDEAARGPQPLAVAGHVPHMVSATEASDRGMKSMEHSYGILLCCSKDEEKLRKQLVASMTDDLMGKDTLDATGGWRVQVKALDSYEERKAADLFRKLVRNKTWVVPTLICRRTWASLNDPTFTSDARKKFLPFHVSTTWTMIVRDGDLRLPLFGAISLSAEDIANQKLLYEGHLKLVGAMNKAGVKLLAGTDSPVPFCFPGSGVHDELELLVKAGLTPAEALKTATLNPAEYLGRLKDLGTIEKGKLADLVLLDADPLKDIKNIRTIHAVMLGGRYFPQADVEKLARGRRP